jgi:RNA polymerase subunit RPABC4/transcription elongation factor Spt4
MPTFKHPCPHCAKFIQRDVAACPFCGTRDPFAPARCPSCSTVIEDRSWVACPKCGQALAGPPPGAPLSTEPSPAEAPAQPAEGGRCSGCGGPMVAGARFCTVCGTLAG